MRTSPRRLVFLAALPFLFGGCLGGGSGRGGESRLTPRVPTTTAGEGAANRVLSPSVATPTPLILGASSQPQVASSATASLQPEGGGASASSAPANPQASPSQAAAQAPSADPTATPFVRLTSSPSGLRAFPLRSAEGFMYDCRFDPALGVAQWTVAPSAGSLPWGRFKLSVHPAGEAPATGPTRLGPGAVGLTENLDGPKTLTLPLAIPPIAEQVASAPSGRRLLMVLEAEAPDGGALLNEAGQPLRLEGSLEVL